MPLDQRKVKEDPVVPGLGRNTSLAWAVDCEEPARRRKTRPISVAANSNHDPKQDSDSDAEKRYVQRMLCQVPRAFCERCKADGDGQKKGRANRCGKQRQMSGVGEIPQAEVGRRWERDL